MGRGGSFFRGWATAASGASAMGSRTCAAASSSCANRTFCVRRAIEDALAEAEARAGDPDRAVAILDEALATSARTGYRAFEAELHRARGEILLKRDPANPAPAEEALQSAIAVASSRAAQLRPARCALAGKALPVDRPPRRSPGRPRARARRLRAHAGDAGDRRGASAAGGLTQAGEVKAQASRRQRLTQL